MKLNKSVILAAVLGFLAYPGLFVPLFYLFAPNVLQVWIHIYAAYLRLWGI